MRATDTIELDYDDDLIRVVIAASLQPSRSVVDPSVAMYSSSND